MDVRKANEMMLRSCGFVYIADRGSVIPANSLCGTGYNSLVPIDIALKYGYTRPCKTCACRTYVESLIRATGAQLCLRAAAVFLPNCAVLP